MSNTKLTEKEKLLENEKIRYRTVEDIKLNRPTAYFADHFTKYAGKEKLAYFLTRNFLFQKIQSFRGAIIECGVAEGGGLMSWVQLSSIIEPANTWRHIYGFDTFEGFPSVHENDEPEIGQKWEKGDLCHDTFEELNICKDIVDRSPFLPQFPGVDLIKGDFMKTGKEFIDNNPHLLVSLLFLDFDLYEPSKKALELFLPRMCKGSLVAFDELNHPRFPGETTALLETMDINKIELHSSPYTPRVSYFVV
jgi:hypothetical protein